MSIMRVCLPLALVICCLAALTMARATDYQLVLPEQLNHRWAHELVTYPFTAEQGACVAESLRLTGPNGPLPVQLSGVEYWPNSRFVKSATLAFIVDALDPLTTNTYTVSYTATPAPALNLAAELTVKVAKDQVEATTSHFGARLLLGEKTYNPPAKADAVPGPVLGMHLAEGAWFGGSRLYGATAISSYTARLTAAGPAFARVECQYRYANGNSLTITVQLNAQGNRLYYTTAVANEQLTDGWDILLTGLPPLAFQYMPQQQFQIPGAHLLKSGWKEREIADFSPGVICNLCPWAAWTNEFEQASLHLAFLDTRPAAKELDADTKPARLPDDYPDARELVIHRLDAGAWVTPPASAGVRVKANAPLTKAEDGAVYLRVNNKAGARRWTIGEESSWKSKLPTLFSPSMVMPDGLEDLNVIKDMVLDWPQTGPQHPHLFLTAAEMQTAGARNPAAVKNLTNVAQLRADLAAYAYFDTMRKSADVICRYDAIIDSDLITPAERKLFRAQMAYLTYRLASPANWSIERGYNSGNPNMTVAHTLNQGLAAAVLSDHPLAKTWSESPISFIDTCLSYTDAAGNWPESSGYARVSVSKFIFYVIAAQRAGLHNFLTDPRFKHMVMYYERTLTPPDPLCAMANTTQHPRVTPPYGRGGNANSIGLGGLVAKATATLDPAFSRIMQWSYAGTCFSTMLGEPMAGYDQLITDPTLPTERPDWRSELLPSIGALFRDGVGTPEENYLLFVTKNATNPDGEIWPSEVGALKIWFAHGKPITRSFPAYPYENYHGLLCNRVMLATNWKPGDSVPAGYSNNETMNAFVTSSQFDYFNEEYQWKQPWTAFASPPKSVPSFPVVAKVGMLPPADQPPVSWDRQALYVRNETAAGTNYLVLRDTVTGGQPTQWQFWTLSRGLSAPGAVAPPAEETEQPSALPSLKPTRLEGNRFTAAGQFGLDLEYYLASPTTTPRYTLRYSAHSEQSGVVRAFKCEQDLLHLQLPGDGCYFVALFPRDHTAAAPTFTTLGDGTVIKVSGAFGTDYNFLSKEARQASAGDAAFSGTVATVQDRPAGLVLALGAAGSVHYRAYGLTTEQSADLRVNLTVLTVNLPTSHHATKLTVQAPDGWKVDPRQTQVTLEKPTPTEYRLSLPADLPMVTLIDGKK